MMIVKPLIVFTMVIALGSSTTAWSFTITRNSTSKLPNGAIDSIDQFNITECNGKDDLCSKFGGQDLRDKCECVCSQDKSTFGFYNNEWKCTKNLIFLQQHAGCLYHLQLLTQGRSSPLYTLPVLGSGNDNNYVYNLPTNRNCTARAENATFLKCDGTWGKLTKSRVKNKLTFTEDTTKNIFIGPYKRPLPVDPSIDGRVIRIPIKCEDQTWSPSQCVMFKIKGQLTCSTVNVPPINTGEPSTPTPSTTTTIGAVYNKKSEDETTPAVAVIAGSVAGGVFFIILIILIIVLIICWKRRKAKTTAKSVRTEVENLAYEQGPDLSMTITRPNSFRPLPAPPSHISPFQSLQRDPSIRIQSHANGINSGPRDQDYKHFNDEPVYGEIDDISDDIYSRLNHQPLNPTRSKNDKVMLANGPSFGPSPEVPRKSGTLISDGSGSGLHSFEQYDVVGGEIKSSLPREKLHTFTSTDKTNSLGPESSPSYDVPESVIRTSSKERPQNNIQDNATLPSHYVNQPRQRDTLSKREDYESVWKDDDDDDLDARIRTSSKERPKNSIKDNASVPNHEVHQPRQRDKLSKREDYESVWEDNDDDDLVARIDLS